MNCIGFYLTCKYAYSTLTLQLDSVLQTHELQKHMINLASYLILALGLKYQ